MSASGEEFSIGGVGMSNQQKRDLSRTWAASMNKKKPPVKGLNGLNGNSKKKKLKRR